LSQKITHKTHFTKTIAELVGQHGAVPPPWFMFPDTHPYCICWRMGAGKIIYQYSLSGGANKNKALMSHNELSILGNGRRHLGGLRGW
jgi:hypothetical protein